MAKSRYADATKAARRAAMSAHKASTATNAGNADASAQPTARAATAPARDARRDELTHVDAKGEVRMVDVSDKAETHRIAIAEGTILMHPETQAMVLQDRAKKGDVLACARVAGIMAIKRTSDIIPMCHPLLITKSKCDIAPIAPAGTPVDDVPEGWAPARADGQVGFHVLVTAGVTGKTGIEMEALTGASAACLTIYDMCKAVDRGMEIVDVRLLHKEGGRSGVWDRAERQVAAVEAVGAADNAPASAPVAVAPAAPSTPPRRPPPSPPQPRHRPSPRSRLSATKTRARPRSSRRLSPSSPAAACAWVRSSITGTTALISMYPLRIPGVITKPDPSTWDSSAPRAGRSTPTRARRTRCPLASCCRVTTMSTW